MSYECGRIVGIHNTRQAARDAVETFLFHDRMDEEVGHEYLYTLRASEGNALQTVVTKWVKEYTEPTVWRSLQNVAYPISEVTA